ncbi:MAG: protein kinase [Phycisphaerales bacterium]
MVYLAFQTSLNRKVAIKVLRPSSCSPESIERMRQEARLLARLKHPSITEVYEIGVLQGPLSVYPYIVMEYVSGESILSFTESRTLTIQQKLSLMEQLCDAIDNAHSHGVYHRDIKPTNILVECNEDADSYSLKVIDFGIAKLIDPENTLDLVTGDSIRLGTTRYMSPERLAGESNGGDVAGDVYSLGIVAAEVFGIPLMRSGPLLSVGYSSMTEADSENHDQGALSGISKVITKMIDPERENRPQSAIAVADLMKGVYWDDRNHSDRSNRYTTRKAIAFAFWVSVLTSIPSSITQQDRSVFQSQEIAARDASLAGAELSKSVFSRLGGMNSALADFNVAEVDEAELSKIINSNTQLAYSFTRAGQPERAIGILDELVARLGRIENLNIEQRSNIYINQGHTYSRLRKYEISAQKYMQAYELISSQKKWDIAFAHNMFNIAHGLQTGGRYGQASDIYIQIVEHEAFGTLPWNIWCTILSGYAGFHWLQGDLPRAEELMRQAIESPPEKQRVDEQQLLAEKESSLGVILRDQNKFDEAEQYLTQGLNRAIEYTEPTNPVVARLIRNLAMNSFHQGRYSESKQLIEQAQAVWQINPNGWVIPLSEVGLLLACIDLETGDTELALERLQVLTDQVSGQDGTSFNKLRILVQNAYGYALALAGDTAAGSELILESDKDLIALLGADHPWSRLSRNRLNQLGLK